MSHDNFMAPRYRYQPENCWGQVIRPRRGGGGADVGWGPSGLPAEGIAGSIVLFGSVLPPSHVRKANISASPMADDPEGPYLTSSATPAPTGTDKRDHSPGLMPSGIPLRLPLETPRRIAIFRGLYLGDLLLAVPALRAIRRQFPQAEITFIGLPWASAFARRYRGYIDRFVEFAGYPGIKEVAVEPERTAHFLAEQQAYGYDLVVQMHGSGLSSNPFALALRGKVTAGYYSVTAPDALALRAVYPEHEHEIYRNLGLAALLGCRELEPRLEFPLYEQDQVEANALLSRLTSQQRPWIGIHAGARPPARRWPADYFAALADELVRRFDAQILLTGGPGEEATVRAVQERMQVSALNLAGATSLGGLGALISRLDLFISNDTGPAHLAVALDTPSITLFGPADYGRWAPLDQARHPTLRHPVLCSPCGYWECPIDHRCLRWLEPELVLLAAQKLLRKEHRQ